jgi:hypothetical protein
MGWDCVHSVRRPLTGLFYQPRTIDDECGALGGMRTDRRNRSTRRKPAPVPLCVPQIPHDLTWTRTRVARVGRRRLTAWRMDRPFEKFTEGTSEFGYCNSRVVCGPNNLHTQLWWGRYTAGRKYLSVSTDDYTEPKILSFTVQNFLHSN